VNSLGLQIPPRMYITLEKLLVSLLVDIFVLFLGDEQFQEEIL
jgi:hypothetical protein